MKEAFEHMGKLNFPHCDILIVDQIGKGISEGGADPNITGLTQGGLCISNIEMYIRSVVERNKGQRLLYSTQHAGAV